MAGKVDKILSCYRDKDLPVAQSAAVITYGLLYNKFAALDPRNLAAAGWRVSSDLDWSTLVFKIGGELTAGNILKETGLISWLAPNASANNLYGFNLKGAGHRMYFDGSFMPILYQAAFHTTDPNGIEFYHNNSGIFHPGGAAYDRHGRSLRLVKNETTLIHGQAGTYTGNNGIKHRTICIFGVEWLADNLAETKYRNGDLIPEVTDNAAWAALATGALCANNNDWSNAFSLVVTAPFGKVDKLMGQYREQSRGAYPCMVDKLMGRWRVNDLSPVAPVTFVPLIESAWIGASGATLMVTFGEDYTSTGTAECWVNGDNHSVECLQEDGNNSLQIGLGILASMSDDILLVLPPGSILKNGIPNEQIAFVATNLIDPKITTVSLSHDGALCVVFFDGIMRREEFAKTGIKANGIEVYAACWDDDESITLDVQNCGIPQGSMNWSVDIPANRFRAYTSGIYIPAQRVKCNYLI